MKNKEKTQYLLNRAKALLKSIELVYEMESRDHDQYAKVNAFSGHKTFAVQLKALAVDVMQEFSDASFYVHDTDSMRSATSSIYSYRKDIMDGTLIEAGKICAFLQAKLGQEQEEIDEIISLVSHRLRSIIREVPEKEIEVQDKVEDLLIGKGYNKGTDFDRETGRVKTGVKESVPDFIFRTLNLAIEVKLIKDAQGPKKVTEEMNADITSYGTQYENIFFIVYDCGGYIQNVDEFKYKLNGRKVYIEVIKH